LRENSRREGNEGYKNRREMRATKEYCIEVKVKQNIIFRVSCVYYIKGLTIWV